MSNNLDISNKESLKEVTTYTNPKRFGVRHVQILLLLGGFVLGFTLRVNMSSAIVSMVKPSDNPNVPYYDWDQTDKSFVLSSFFWGYVVAQIPSTLLAKKYGGKNVMAISTAICSILTILIPLMADVGSWQLVCAFRILIGLTQGPVLPCIHTLLASWAPTTERGFLTTTVYSGGQLGSVIILATSGFMASSDTGWPLIFYVSGGVTLGWSILYFIFGADSPKTSKVISVKEKEYIEKYTGISDNKKLPIPWKSILTSRPFIALIIAQCGFVWGFYTLITEIPTYMDTALQLNLKSNALLSALPYFVMWILSLIVSPISDLLINRGILSVVASRKIFNSIGQWVPMVFLIALSYMTKDETDLAILFLTLAVGINSGSFVGYMVNHMDLSPNFAGPLMGISNGIANLLSIFAPLIVGVVVENEDDPAEWRIMFFITAGIYLVCNGVFVVYGKATIQEWNEPPKEFTQNSLPKTLNLSIKNSNEDISLNEAVSKK